MLHREITAVCSEIRTKHINTVWAKRRSRNVKPGGTYSDHCALKDYEICDFPLSDRYSVLWEKRQEFVTSSAGSLSCLQLMSKLRYSTPPLHPYGLISSRSTFKFLSSKTATNLTLSILSVL